MTSPTSTDPTSAPVPGPAPDPAVRPAPVIEMVDVGKVYASGSLEVAALRSVSIRIERGEFVAVIGPSGSGKSTLMHIIGCLDVPTSGAFRLAGHDVAGISENQLSDVRNRMIGFVFQQFNLLAYLPAWRNVELPLVYSRRRTRRAPRAGADRAREGRASPTGPTIGPVSCRAGSSSAWPSPGPSSPSRR